jgi:hypothetical protein
MTEEERAQLHRDQELARCQARCTRLEQLAGDPARASTVRTAWQPLLDLQQPDEVLDGCVCATPPYDPETVLAN